jgi:hypothetical protein
MRRRDALLVGAFWSGVALVFVCRIGQPAFLVLAVFAIWISASVWWAITFRTCRRLLRTRIAAGLCVHCGYDLRGVEGRLCPECGRLPTRVREPASGTRD